MVEQLDKRQPRRRATATRRAFIYGNDERTEGYVFDVDRAVVVARFMGGISPVTLTPRQFCPVCAETFGRDEPRSIACPKCRAETNITGTLDTR